MDIIEDLKGRIKANKTVNLGIGLDINKLILLINNMKSESRLDDYQKKLLEAKMYYYKDYLCTILCNRLQDGDECPKECSATSKKCSNLWCDDIITNLENHKLVVGESMDFRRKGELHTRIEDGDDDNS